jgi:hypothetical protein
MIFVLICVPNPQEMRISGLGTHVKILVRVKFIILANEVHNKIYR